MTAMRLCLERIVPPRRDRAIQFDMPSMQKAHDAVIAMRRLVDAANSGELSPMDATELAKLVEAFTKAVAVHEHEERITALEKKDKR